MNAESYLPKGHCGYCEAPLRGRYRHVCGTLTPQQPLSFRTIRADLAERIIQIERGLVRTTMDLLIRPTRVMDAFMAGRRRHYTHPFSYLLLVGAVVLMLLNLIDGDAFWNDFAEMVRPQAPTRFSDDQKARFVSFHSNLYSGLPYWLMLFTLPLAALNRLLFWRRSESVAMHWVVALYAVAIVSLCCTVLMAILRPLGVPLPALMLWMNLALLIVQVSYLSRWLRLSWYLVPVVAMAAIIAYGFMGTIQHLLAIAWAVAPR